jgi:predicted nucleic acid-binding protein
MAWYFADEADPYADGVADSLTSHSATVPALFHLEIANILVLGERRKRSTEAQASAFLSRLTGLPIRVDDQTVAHAWSDTIALARNHELSIYDAAYLELAVRLKVSIATLDEKLRNAAKAIGVPIFAS